MKILIYLSIFILSVIRVFPIDYKIVDEKFEVNNFIHFSKFKNKIALLGIAEYLAPFFKARVYVYENGVWNKLPETAVTSEGVIVDIITDLKNNIIFDSLGNIWLSGVTHLYKYDNNQWHAYIINDQYKEDRIINELACDAYNNIWFTSYVLNEEKNYDFSELYKYDGDIFQQALTAESFGTFSPIFSNYSFGHKLTALPDGRMVIYRPVYEHYKSETGIEDLYFINQDFSIEKNKLETSSRGDEYNFITKRVIDIYVEDENTLYFALGVWVSGYKPYQCCSGFSIFDNGKWYVLDQKDGLSSYSNNPEPIKKIVKNQYDEHLLIGMNFAYTFKDVKLKRISYDSLLNGMTIIPCNEYWRSDSGMAIFKERLNFFLKEGTSFVLMGIMNFNGDIWILEQKGIIILKSGATYSSDAQINNLDIFPVPAHDIIYLNRNDSNNYRIYTINGYIIKEGVFINGQININDLPIGTYFIRFSDSTLINYYKFIKL